MLKWQLMLKCDKVCPAISTCHHDSIRNSNGCNEKNNGKTEGKRKGCSGDEAVGGQEGRKTEGRKTENAGCYYLSSTKWMDGNCIGDKNNVWLQSEECDVCFYYGKKPCANTPDTLKMIARLFALGVVESGADQVTVNDRSRAAPRKHVRTRKSGPNEEHVSALERMLERARCRARKNKAQMMWNLTPSSAICSSTPLFELEKTLQAFMRSIVSSVGLRLTHATINIRYVEPHP